MSNWPLRYLLNRMDEFHPKLRHFLIFIHYFSLKLLMSWNVPREYSGCVIDTPISPTCRETKEICIGMPYIHKQVFLIA